MNDVIGKRIKELRTEAGLTQKMFGERLSVSQDTVSLWETGRSLPTTELVIEICKMLNISADYLLGLKDF